MTSTPTTGDGGPGAPRIVVGVDGSPGAFSALVWALTAAARSGAALEAVSAVPDGDSWRHPFRGPAVPDTVRAATEAHAQAFVADARAVPEVTAVPGTADVPVQVAVAGGAPAGLLLRRAEGARLLVVGSRGRSGVRSAVLGSVALHCAAAAPCPVVVVHPAQPAPALRVVVGIDEGDASRAALLRAVEQARPLGATVEVVSVVSPYIYWSDDDAAIPAPQIDEQVDAARSRGERAVQQVLGDRRDVRVEVVGDVGSPADVLVRQAEGAALLVVGSNGHHELTGVLLGSVALHCAVHAPCPVMVVHPEPDRAAAEQRPAADAARV